MQDVRSIAWKTVSEMMGWTIQRSASGTPSASTFLRGDWTWAAPPGGVGGGAPTDAEYIVRSSNTTLSAERVLTDTATVTWDYATAGQAKAVVPNLSGTNTGDQTLASLGGVPTSRTVAGKALSADVTLAKGDVGLGNVDNTSDAAKPVSTATQTALNGKETAGAATAAVATHVGLADPHAQYALESALAAVATAGTYASLTSIPSTFAPAAHAANHKSGATDAIKLDELAAPTDVTTLNATTLAHGLCPKLSGNVAHALRGDGTFGTMSGGSDPWTYAKLASPFQTSSATAVDITGLAFTPAANTSYEFEGQLMLRTATATVNPRAGVAWATGLTDGVANIDQAQTATTILMARGNIAAALLVAVGGLPNTTQSWPCTIWGFIVAGATPSATVRFQLASETAGTNVTAQAGSFMKYRAV